MIERYTAESTRLDSLDDHGISDEDKIELDHVVQQLLRRMINRDPRHRLKHFALMVLTLESDGEEGQIITSDVISSMTHVHMHEVFRDWIRKETQ